jgi:hypothetical protein
MKFSLGSLLICLRVLPSFSKAVNLSESTASNNNNICKSCNFNDLEGIDPSVIEGIAPTY